MAWAKPTQLTSWSYSRYSTYKTCPLKAKLSYIDKIPMKKNAAMARGAAIAEISEKYLKGLIPAKVPEELQNFSQEFKDLRKRYAAAQKKDPSTVVVEETWALRKDWTETTWNDWNGCWVRIKMDHAEVLQPKGAPPLAVPTDFKTGKYRPDNMEDYLDQLELYSTGALIKWGQRFPDIVVKPRLVYLDAGVIHEPQTYTMQDLPRLKKEWEKKTKAMLADQKFAPKPNAFCKWCDYSKSNGGTCKF